MTKPLLNISGNLETIIPIFKKWKFSFQYTREEITTPDNDFLHLDWLESDKDSKNLIILSHGLEGSSYASYIRRSVDYFNNLNFNCLAWNQRSCSGVLNKRERFYHAGSSDELELVISHAIDKKQYQNIYLIGFSLGANVSLKYLGEKGINLPVQVKGAAVFSAPLDLKSCAISISTGIGKLYSHYFLHSIKKKIIKKRDLLEKKGFNIKNVNHVKSLYEYDKDYTAPIHGFSSRDEFYKRTSSINFLNDIRVPVLIVNAINDPFLAKECYPISKLKDSSFITLETPQRGGHVTFPYKTDNSFFWPAKRALNFFTKN